MAEYFDWSLIDDHGDGVYTKPQLAKVKKFLEETREKARRDKMFFANEVLGYDFQECHRELFALYPDFDSTKPWAEQIAGYEDIMVLWPRGHFKSTAVKVVLMQAVLNNPDLTILLMQGSVQVTQLFLKEIRMHFTGEADGSRLCKLFPEFCGTPRVLEANDMRFTVPCRKRKQIPQATFTVASPKSIKTGQHYLLGVFDDLQNESNSHNPRLLQKVQDEFVSYQPLVQHGGRWVSGTRWAFGDLYEKILEWSKLQNIGSPRKWVTSIKTCWTDDNSGVRFPKFFKKNGEKDGFTREDLLQLMHQNPGWFACQYLNTPVMASEQLFTEQSMLEACVAPQDAPPLSQTILFIDLAATENEQSDDSVIFAGRVDGRGRAYVVDALGGRWNTSLLAVKVVEMALRHRPLRILIEQSPTYDPFVTYLRVVAREKGIVLPIEPIKVDTRKGAKHMRITTLAGHINNKRLMFFVGLPCWPKMVEQFTTYPKAKYGHDDYPDTAALMMNHFGASYIPLGQPEFHHNSMIALLERDIVAERIVTSDKEVVRTDSDMGSDFAC